MQAWLSLALQSEHAHAPVCGEPGHLTLLAWRPLSPSGGTVTAAWGSSHLLLFRMGTGVRKDVLLTTKPGKQRTDQLGRNSLNERGPAPGFFKSQAPFETISFRPMLLCKFHSVRACPCAQAHSEPPAPATRASPTSSEAKTLKLVFTGGQGVSGWKCHRHTVAGLGQTSRQQGFPCCSSA